jgi:hypothetical protein
MMPDVMLILIAGGFMLAAAVPKPDAVGRAWLRWTGGLALLTAVAGAAVVATGGHGAVDVPAFYRRIQAGLIAVTVAVAFLHFAAAFAGMGWTRRVIGVAGFLVAVLAGSNRLHEAMLGPGTAVAVPPKALSMALQTIACAGAAAVPGLAFAFALFPVSGVTTPAESARSFRRLQAGLLAVLSCRAAVSVGGVLAFSRAAATSGAAAHVDFRLAAVRWLLGIVAPAAFAVVGYRFAARGRAFAACAVLLLGGLCALNGESLALLLVRDTGLPF